MSPMHASPCHRRCARIHSCLIRKGICEIDRPSLSASNAALGEATPYSGGAVTAPLLGRRSGPGGSGVWRRLGACRRTRSTSMGSMRFPQVACCGEALRNTCREWQWPAKKDTMKHNRCSVSSLGYAWGAGPRGCRRDVDQAGRKSGPDVRRGGRANDDRSRPQEHGACTWAFPWRSPTTRSEAGGAEPSPAANLKIPPCRRLWRR